jgi:hypothetical protein
MHADLFTRHERMCAIHVWSFLICHTQSKLTVWTAIIRSTCVNTRRSAANTRVVTFIYDQFWHTEVPLSYYMIVATVLFTSWFITWIHLLFVFPQTTALNQTSLRSLRLTENPRLSVPFLPNSTLSHNFHVPSLAGRVLRKHPVEASEYSEYTRLKAPRYTVRPQVIFLAYCTYLL